MVRVPHASAVDTLCHNVDDGDVNCCVHIKMVVIGSVHTRQFEHNMVQFTLP